MLDKFYTASKVFVPCIAFLGFSVASANGEQGYFVGVHSGAAMPGKYSSLLDDGFSVGGQYGYRLENYRTAVALNLINNSLSGSADGSYNLLNLDVNFYYDFNYDGTFVPFIGAGVGYLNAWKGSCNGNSDCANLTTGSELLYQGIMGMGIQGERLRFDLQYRYVDFTSNHGFYENVIEGVFNIFL